MQQSDWSQTMCMLAVSNESLETFRNNHPSTLGYKENEPVLVLFSPHAQIRRSMGGRKFEVTWSASSTSVSVGKKGKTVRMSTGRKTTEKEIVFALFLCYLLRADEESGNSWRWSLHPLHFNKANNKLITVKPV